MDFDQLSLLAIIVGALASLIFMGLLSTKPPNECVPLVGQQWILDGIGVVSIGKIEESEFSYSAYEFTYVSSNSNNPWQGEGQITSRQICKAGTLLELKYD